MRCVSISSVAVFLALLLPWLTASAQSGSRTPGRFIPSGGPAVQPGSTTRPQGSGPRDAGSMMRGSATKGSMSKDGMNAGPVAMEGYCPVCLAKGKGWVKGNPAFSTVYRGSTYLFPAAGQRDMFSANPEMFAPVMGGNCVVTFVDGGGKIVAGDIRNGVKYRGRYYFMASPQNVKTFSSNPSRYAAAASQAEAPMALNGYCAVAIHDMRKWVRGNEDYVSVYDGKKYLFPGPEQKAAFEANPAKYAPVMGGDCVVCQQNMSKRMPGSIFHSAFYKDRLFLFPSAEQQATFTGAPQKFADADLALGGNDVVSTAAGSTVAGRPGFATMHHGLRYQFASEANREKFLANPSQFVK